MLTLSTSQQNLYFQIVISSLEFGGQDAFTRGMQGKLITATWLILLFLGLATVAQGQIRGQLEVTVVVESSTAWVQDAGGNWIFVVANAPALKDTLSAVIVSAHDQKQESAKKLGDTKPKVASQRRPVS